MQGRALVCGCGALGSMLANTLVRAGVGLVRIVDRDFVETTNLQRQTLFDELDVAQGLPKAVAAAREALKDAPAGRPVEPRPRPPEHREGGAWIIRCEPAAC